MYLKVWICLLFVIHLTPESLGYYENSKHVKPMNQIDILNLQNDRTDDVWLIQFYKSSDQDMPNTSKAFERAARAMEGYVKVGAVDVEQHPLLMLTLKITDIPSYGFYSYYKYLPDVFSNFDRIKSIQGEVTKQLGYVFEERGIFRYLDDKRNYELGTTDIDYRVMDSEKPWAIIYFEPECKKCLQFADDWRSLLNAFDGVVQFGSVNNPLYQVYPGEDLVYPIVQFYAGGPKKGVYPDNYTGVVDYNSLFEYFKGKLPERKPIHITGAKTAQGCLNEFYCVFSFFPQREHCDETCLDKNLMRLEAAAKDFKLHSVYWAWNVYNEQPELEKVFALEQCNHPVLVFLNMQIGKYVKIDTDEIKADIITKITERRYDPATFTQDLSYVEIPDIKELEETKKECVKDEL